MDSENIFSVGLELKGLEYISCPVLIVVDDIGFENISSVDLKLSEIFTIESGKYLTGE